MPFYYDKISGKLGTAQYYQYLENETYIRDLKSVSSDATNYQLAEIRRTLQIINPQAKENFEQLSLKVCGTLENGFRSIVSEINETNILLEESNWRLNEINEGINRLHSMLDWKTDLIIEEQRISNFYLGKIVKLLKIPDSQKQRGYHVEQGLSFLKNAMLDGRKSEFYNDALEEFQKAYEIESKDYFALYQLGIIYFNSLAHFDIEKAEQFFKDSARYARAAANSTPKASPISYTTYEETYMTNDTLLLESASALNYASRCNYILNKKEDAIRLAKEAYQINKTNPDYGFHLAKTYAVNNNILEANTLLSEVIDFDRNYFIKVLSDPDFLNEIEIVSFLKTKAENYIQNIKSKIADLKSLLIERSIASSDFIRICNILVESNYINARIADEELNRKIHRYEVIAYTYDDYYIRNPDFVTEYSSSFETGIRVGKKQLEATVSDVIELEHANYLKKKEYENLDILQRITAHANARKKTNQTLIRRSALISLPFIGFIATYGNSKILAMLILASAIILISKYWSDK